MIDYTYSVPSCPPGSKPHIPVLKVEGEKACEEQPDTRMRNLEREAHQPVGDLRGGLT